MHSDGGWPRRLSGARRHIPWRQIVLKLDPAAASSAIVRASHEGGMEGALDTSDPYSRPEAALSLVSAHLSYNYR